MSATFEVVHGNPSDEELAVVISLLTAAASAPAGATQAPAPSVWARPGFRVTLPSGPGAWFSSGLPR